MVEGVVTVGGVCVESAGVDYLTMTYVPKRNKYDPVASFVNLCGFFKSGKEKRARKVMQYEGWGCESGFYGHDSATGSTMGQFWGSGAVYVATRLMADGIEGEHVTRLDLQVTVDFGTEEAAREEMARILEESALSELMTKGRMARRVAQTIERGGGHTIYFGSRKSPKFARVYLKGKESPEQYGAGTVRYEIEYKEESARSVWEGLRDSEFNHARYAAARVEQFLALCGVTLPFTPDALTVAPLPYTVEEPKDSVKRLEWLRRQVRPTVFWLTSLGLLDEVLTALGVSQINTGNDEATLS